MSKSMSQMDDEQPKDRSLRPEALMDAEISKSKLSQDESLRPEAQLPKAGEVTVPDLSHPGRRQRRPVGTTWSVFTTVISAAFIVATLFSIWSPGSLIVKSLPDQMVDALSVAPLGAITPTLSVSMPLDFPSDRIGIVVGHRGNENDKGAVCSDGLTELDVNTNIATYVQQKLIKAGYNVDLLDEFDPRLSNYQAGLLLSIHADSCDYINESATGFKVAAALAEQKQDNSERLVACMADRYAKLTGLKYHYQSITQDMTYYHAYSEINPYTVAGIIEVGFLNLDKEILTTKPELLADGIVNGISCYMNDETITTQPTE
ncbi:MAG: N-acetylmuramoyl-L-alanine amidase [Anaerolineaceae bacterium]